MGSGTYSGSKAERVHILHKLPQMIEKEGKVPAVFNVLSAALIPSPDDGRVGWGWGLKASFNDDYRCRHPKLLKMLND